MNRSPFGLFLFIYIEFLKKIKKVEKKTCQRREDVVI